MFTKFQLVCASSYGNRSVYTIGMILLNVQGLVPIHVTHAGLLLAARTTDPRIYDGCWIPTSHFLFFHHQLYNLPMYHTIETVYHNNNIQLWRSIYAHYINEWQLKSVFFGLCLKPYAQKRSPYLPTCFTRILVVLQSVLTTSVSWWYSHQDRLVVNIFITRTGIWRDDDERGWVRSII